MKIRTRMQLPWFGAALGLAIAAVGGAQGCGRKDASASAGVLGAVPAVVFAKRANFTTTNGVYTPVVAGGSDQVIDYLRYVPGGGVYTLTPPRPDGKLDNLTSAFPNADVNGIDVSFDASQVVFSMMTSADDKYHIYIATVALSADGTHAVRQLTFGPHDDVMPVYLPGDRIAFVTNQPYTPMGTRADEYEHAAIVSQIATISTSGGDADRQVCGQNLSHTVNLYLRYDGTLGFSRWEHFNSTNDVKLFKMNPDCTQMLAVAGQHNKPFNSLVQAHEISPEVIIGVATQRNETLQAGALVQVSSMNAAGQPDEEHATFTVITPGVPVTGDPSPVGRYRSPNVLPDGRLLVSWADGVVNDQNETTGTPPNFGLYLYDQTTQRNQLVYDDPQTSELYASPLVTRTSPPIISDVRRPDPSLPLTIGSIDVTQTSLDETVDGAQFSGTNLSDALGEAVSVRVVEGFSSEIGSTPMFGLTMFEGAAVLGEAPVQNDGSWLAKVPAYIPMHLQPIDKFGMVIRNQRLWIQGMPGEARTCGGCHESRTTQVQPRLGSGLTLAQQMGPQNFVIPIAQRQEYGWNKVVQPILDQHCVSCHGPTSTLAQKTYQVIATDQNGVQTTYTIPWLDLTGDTMTVSYDEGVYTFSKSYVSLYYPAQLNGGDSRGLTVVGDLPPIWMQPGSARTSQMIQTLNIQSPDGALAWAGATQHDVVEGSPLSWTEKQALVRSVDLGGQWVSRQNVANSACWEGGNADNGSCANGTSGTLYP